MLGFTDFKKREPKNINVCFIILLTYMKHVNVYVHLCKRTECERKELDFKLKQT